VGFVTCVQRRSAGRLASAVADAGDLLPAGVGAENRIHDDADRHAERHKAGRGS
jgi:hypothetical protein